MGSDSDDCGLHPSSQLIIHQFSLLKSCQSAFDFGARDQSVAILQAKGRCLMRMYALVAVCARGKSFRTCITA